MEDIIRYNYGQISIETATAFWYIESVNCTLAAKGMTLGDLGGAGEIEKKKSEAPSPGKKV